eukprot:COSAG02_NODE_35128_length_473_cov_0.959893_1_plen_44_part_00
MVTAQDEGAHRTFTEHERWLFDLHGVSRTPAVVVRLDGVVTWH